MSELSELEDMPETEAIDDIETKGRRFGRKEDGMMPATPGATAVAAPAGRNRRGDRPKPGR